jgi:hypothetical protein
MGNIGNLTLRNMSQRMARLFLEIRLFQQAAYGPLLLFLPTTRGDHGVQDDRSA